MADPAWSALSTAGLVALAELGDRSQLVCIALAARHRAAPVLVGAALAFTTSSALAVLAGRAVAHLVPTALLLALSGTLMLGFAIWTWRDDGGEEIVEARGDTARPLFATAALLFTSELGDKTQLSVVGMAATMDPAGVFVGASLGMIAMTAVSVAAGRALHATLGPEVMRRAATGVFTIAGLAMLWAALA